MQHSSESQSPHPTGLPDSTAHVRQTRAASKHQKVKATSNKIAQTKPDPHLQCLRLLPSMGDLVSQRRHSSLTAGNISQLPGLHKGMGSWRCLWHSQGHSHPHGQGQALAAPPATPTHVTGRGCLSFTYPGAVDRVVKVRSFRGQQQPATINGFGLQRNSRETLRHSGKRLNVDQHHEESMLRNHGKLQQPQHEGSCVSSASRTQANSAFPVQGTWCLVATRGVTHTVCQWD